MVLQSLDKKQLRKKMKALLNAQTPRIRREKSLLVGRKLLESNEFQQAQTIFFYASCELEVDTFNIMKKASALGKHIALPYFKKGDPVLLPMMVDDLENALHCGDYGIKIPKKDISYLVNLEQLDMVVVPGLAFDQNNHRLGRGAGYYDRFLASLTRDIFTVGLAFDFQMLDVIPTEKHDVRLSAVFSCSA